MITRFKPFPLGARLLARFRSVEAGVIMHLYVVALAGAMLGVSTIGGVSHLWAGEAARLLQAKGTTEQRDILLHAVRSGGHDCAELSTHLYVGYREGMDFFSVRCADKVEYMISVESTGEMQSRVMMCRVLEALHVRCFKKL